MGLYYLNITLFGGARGVWGSGSWGKQIREIGDDYQGYGR